MMKGGMIVYDKSAKSHSLCAKPQYYFVFLVL
jgi:hypothetical protein